MIFITGDTHSDFRRFSVDSFYKQKEFSGNPEDKIMLYEQILRVKYEK